MRNLEGLTGLFAVCAVSDGVREAGKMPAVQGLDGP